MKVDLFAPMLCSVCRENVVYDEFPICPECLPKLQQLLAKRCRSCGKPATGCECGGAAAVRALFFYGDPVSKRIMYMLKYNADRRAADFFVRLALDACGVSGCDGVAYVPRDAQKAQIRLRSGKGAGGSCFTRARGSACFAFVKAAARQSAKAAFRKGAACEYEESVLYRAGNNRTGKIPQAADCG